MEFEALLFGLEPLTALAVGVGAIILTPVLTTIGKATGKDGEAIAESLSKSAAEATKSAIVWGMEAGEKAQIVFAEAEESFRDLVAEAKAEHTAKKLKVDAVEPREVEIVE